MKCSEHTPECPVPLYEKDLARWKERRAAYVKATTAPERTYLEARESTASIDFDRLNPRPPVPKRVR
jgi:hypothetical protein